ncbi:MAG: beta-lactamase family protein [Clostridia bacterium]|nr:beta-lactamase family protein [Clostridia bacterium]
MKKTVSFFVAFLLLLSAFLIPVCAVSPNDPIIATVQSAVAAQVGTDTPGAAVVVLENGEIAMMEGFGYADIESRTLVVPDTVFEIGDLSAIFVTLAAYRLAEEGQLSLQASIDTYLPGDFMQKLDLAHPVTTEQLLLSSAGFEGRTFDLIFQKPSHRFDSLKEALLAQVPKQIAQPGTLCSYSPFGLALAAYVVECAADLPYAEYVQEKILNPLEITDTVLDPDGEGSNHKMAKGHIVLDEGNFALAGRQGRSYAGLYPASGALSTAADLSALLSFLLKGNAAVLSDASRQIILQTVSKNGIFSSFAPGLFVRGSALGVTDSTTHFGASLWIAPARNIGAVVLTNAANSELLSVPAALCGASSGIAVEAGGTMLDLETLAGTYATAQGEGNSFVGRFMRKNACVQAEVTDGGELLFLGKTMHQIAPGIFAEVGKDVATLQFLLDEEGEVRAVVTADGEAYLPVSFFEQRIPATILFYAVLLLCLWFLLGGAFSLMRYFAWRYEPHAESFVFTLPLLFAALMSICALLQILVGIRYGGGAFSSFFDAMSVITLLCSIGTIGCFLLAFLASITKRGMTARVARNATLLVVLVLLLHFFGLSV